MVGDIGNPSQAAAIADVQATFCATLLDEWVALGVRHAVVAPGSRSTPMAVAMAAHPDLAVHVVHDERVAGFVALGLGLDGIPSLLLCTSGTAAANFLPAVVEAGLSAVAMIVLTADRPEELRNVGAPQTIDQIDLYGRHAVWFHDAGVPSPDQGPQWRPLATTAFHRSLDGPIHLNLPFREPLLGTSLELPASDERSWAPAIAEMPRPATDSVPEGIHRSRGVILAGGRSGVDPALVERLATMTDWPIIADPISAMRHLDGVVTTAESLLRHQAFADDHLPEVIVRIGRPSASKTLTQWVVRAVADAGATLVQVGGPGVIDPDRNVGAVCSIVDVIDAHPAGASGTTWAADWQLAERRADEAIGALLGRTSEVTEPGVARLVATHLPPSVALTVSSSMPVRDLEWFAGQRAVAHANRGANGIDGVMSTALGLAIARGSGAVLIGDLAFVHDSNALAGLGARHVDLRVVVVDNDGGGIFSFLPQARTLSHDRFEQLFGTPIGVDVLGLAAAHGIATHDIEELDQLRALLGRPGPWVARVTTNRTRNVVVHQTLHDAVHQALG